MQEKGLRQNQVGNVQGWFYPADGVMVLWECFFESQVRNIKLPTDKMACQFRTDTPTRRNARQSMCLSSCFIPHSIRFSKLCCGQYMAI